MASKPTRPRAKAKRKEKVPPPVPPTRADVLWLIAPAMPKVTGEYRKVPKKAFDAWDPPLKEVYELWKQCVDSLPYYIYINGAGWPMGTDKMSEFPWSPWKLASCEDDVVHGRGLVVSSKEAHNPALVPAALCPPCCRCPNCKVDLCCEKAEKSKHHCKDPKCQHLICQEPEEVAKRLDLLEAGKGFSGWKGLFLEAGKGELTVANASFILTESRDEWDLWNQDKDATMPKRLYVIAPLRLRLEGEYQKSSQRWQNGCPVWVPAGGESEDSQSDIRGFIYSTAAGYWAVSATEEQMLANRAYMQTSAPHMGLEPHNIMSWKVWNGEQLEWQADMSACVTILPEKYAEWAKWAEKRAMKGFM